MRLVLRTDLGGRATKLPSLTALSEIEVSKPFVLLVGGNGAGKSSLFAALRQATGLVGAGIGRFPERESSDRPLSFKESWHRNPEPIDLARHALMVEDGLRSWTTNKVGHLPNGAVGVLDPVALGWIGQRVWLHDGRVIDDHNITDNLMNLTARRRSADDRARSHGQQMTGRLRYAIAWALGLVNVNDSYDAPEPDRADSRRAGQIVPREIFARLAGHRPDDAARTTERWLLLDEPETGLAPIAFARLMALLADGAEDGKLRVLCATHSSLAFELASHPKVQVVDLDGYAQRLTAAREALADPNRRARMAAEELEVLTTDCELAVATDRGLRNQRRFTAYEAESIPYPEAIVPPYGNAGFLTKMHCSEPIVEGEDATEPAPKPGR